MKKLFVLLLLMMSSATLFAQTVVSEGWDESSAKEIWSDRAVSWSIDWVTTYSDGKEERTPFALSEHRELKTLTEWNLPLVAFLSKDYPLEFSDLQMNLVSSTPQNRTIDDAVFSWITEKREISDKMTIHTSFDDSFVTSGSLLEDVLNKNRIFYNRWEAQDPFDCKVSYKGKDYSFGKKEVVISRKDSVVSNSVKSLDSGSNGIRSDVLVYKIGDYVSEVPAIIWPYNYSTEAKSFFPLDKWGWLYDVKQSVANNMSQDGFVYIWSLHFANGVLPVTVSPGSSIPNWAFEYFEYTPSPLYNSAVYIDSENKWVNAIASDDYDMMRWRAAGPVMDTQDVETANQISWDEGHGVSVFTKRFDIKIEDDGKLILHDAFYDKYTKDWGSSYFKAEWGKLIDAKQTIANDARRMSFVYVLSLHFSNGYVMPGIVTPGNILPDWQFDACEKTTNSTLNSAYYDKTEKVWKNAIAYDFGNKMYWAREGAVLATKKYDVASSQNWDEGHGTSVNTERYDLQLTPGRIAAKDSYKEIYMGSWGGWSQSDYDAEFRDSSRTPQTFKTWIQVGKHGKVKWNDEEITNAETGDELKKELVSEECKVPTWKFLIVPDEGYEVASVVLNGLDVINYVKDHVLTISSIPENICLVFKFCGKDETPIEFEDSKVEALCLDNWDINGDGVFDKGEATVVESLEKDYKNVFRSSDIMSFEEFRFFTGLKTIEDEAFYNCKNLSKIALPESLMTIGKSCFSWCGAFSITIPDAVKSIGENAFLCSGLKSVILGDGVESIGDRAFNYCQSLTALTIGKNLKSIGNEAFTGDNNLNAIHIADLAVWCENQLGSSNPLQWAKHLFVNGEEIKNLVIPDGVTFIADYAFAFCESFTSVTIPGSVKSIGDEAFYGCKGLSTLTIPEGVETIGSMSFQSCSGLTSVSLPKSLRSLNYQAFKDCSGLIMVTIPEGVTSLGNFVFDGCSSLTSIVSMIEKPFEIETYVFSGLYEIPLTVPAGTSELYKTTKSWNIFETINEMENQFVEQGYAVFNSETGTLTFKYGEKPAGDNVYDTDNTDYTWESQAWDCSQIKKVVFDPSFAAARPKSTTHWFYKSESLTEIVGIEYLNTSEVTTMRGMFSGCGNLTNLDVHKFVTDNVTNMAWMFENCSSLKSLDVSKFNTSNVTDLGAMFDNCPSLTNLDVSHFDTGNAKSLNSMFRGCSGLTSLDVSNFNTGNATDVCGMFENCSSLKSLDVSKFNTNNVTDLGAMFANCPSLTSLDVRHFDTSNAKSLNSMFRDCSGLTLIDLSSFDTNNAINMGAMFKNCNSLTTIHVGEKWNTTNVEDSDEMFAGCEKLVGGKGTAYDADHVDATYARIDGGVDNPGYYTGTVSESITISKALQVTYMSDKNLDFTGYPDLKAYVATGYDKASGTIWLTRVKEVPANTGFLLMGEANTYEIPVKAGGLSAYHQNMFRGTIEGTTIQTTEGDYTNYYLSNGDAGVGFYKVQGSVELKPNRAYLSVPTEIPVVGATGSTETIKVSAAGQVPYYNSQSLDFSSLDAQGVKAYTATGYDYTSGTIWLTRVKQVPAETGILIMAPQGEYPVPTASVASVYANMFKGTLTGTTIQTHETIADEDYINYYLSSGDAGVGFYKVTKEGGVTIGANRCYLPIKNKEVAAGTRSAGSGQNQIAFREAEEVIGIPLFRGVGENNDGTTNLTPALSKGEGEWYTLQGQRVAKPGKGLYIRNGKVVVIK